MATIHKVSNHLEKDLKKLLRSRRRKLIFYPLFILLCWILQVYLFIGTSDVFARLPGFNWHLMKCFLSRMWPMVPFVSALILIAREPYTKANEGRLRAGIHGEERMGHFLAMLPDQYDVIQNLYVSWNGRIGEVDFVVVGPTGVFVLEIKNYSGIVRGDATDMNLQHVTTHKAVTCHNPVKQVKTHVHTIGNFLRNAGYPIWVQGIVAFVGNASVFIENQNEVPIFQANQLEELQRYILENIPNIPIQPQIQREIVRRLIYESRIHFVSD